MKNPFNDSAKIKLLGIDLIIAYEENLNARDDDLHESWEKFLNLWGSFKTLVDARIMSVEEK
jgi:hypothetical protein